MFGWISVFGTGGTREKTVGSVARHLPLQDDMTAFERDGAVLLKGLFDAERSPISTFNSSFCKTSISRPVNSSSLTLGVSWLTVPGG